MSNEYTMEGRTALRDAADLIEQQARRITELKRGIGNAMQRANETGMGSLAFQDTVFTMHAMLAAALAEPAAQEVSRQSAIIDGASGHHAVEPPASAASASEGWTDAEIAKLREAPGKLYIVMRSDLKMGRGKEIAQGVGHFVYMDKATCVPCHEAQRRKGA